MKWYVYEVQREERWRKFRYVVEEADSVAEAIEFAQDGEPESDCGELGEGDLGDSGWDASPQDENHECWDRAAQDLCGMLKVMVYKPHRHRCTNDVNKRGCTVMIPAVPPDDFSGTEGWWIVSLKKLAFWDGVGLWFDAEMQCQEWWRLVDQGEKVKEEA
jgi:hypothetical protein